jgi:hypothetical protein
MTKINTISQKYLVQKIILADQCPQITKKYNRFCYWQCNIILSKIRNHGSKQLDVGVLP